MCRKKEQAGRKNKRKNRTRIGDRIKERVKEKERIEERRSSIDYVLSLPVDSLNFSRAASKQSERRKTLYFLLLERKEEREGNKESIQIQIIFNFFLNKKAYLPSRKYQ